MSKVTPISSPSQQKTNKTHDATYDSVSNVFEAEEDEFSKIQPSTKVNRILSCPIRLFLMTTLITLIILCAVTVYLAVFVGLYTSVVELTNKTVISVEHQVKNYIDIFLGDLKTMSKLTASHFNNGLVTKKDYRKYLYQQFNNSDVCVGYFLYINNKTERYSYTLINGNFLYTYQENGFPGIIRDKVNITTGQVIKQNFTVSTTPNNLITSAFYIQAVSDSNRLKLEGVFGSPFYTIGGDISIPYSTKVYDPSVYPVVKNLIGVTRATMPLHLLSSYLSGLTVFQRGYVLLTEFNSTVAVAGSIKTTTDDGTNNLSLFNLTQKDAGQLMSDIFQQFDGMNNLPSKIFISSKGVKYVISISDYKFDNLEWRLFIVVYDDDVSFTTNLSIGISIGVSIIIIVIGLIYSTLLSKTITTPVTNLKEQLVYIKSFDLDKVSFSSSIFREMNQIMDDLEVTVLWLKQVKSFIPSTVFYQIHGNDTTYQDAHKYSSHKETDINISKYGYEDTHTLGSFHIQKTDTSYMKNETSSSTLKDSPTNNSIFKLGLHKKTCSIIHILLSNFELHTSPHDISLTFSKLTSMIRNIANIYQAHFQINSTEDILLVIDQKPNKKHPSELSLECALKVCGIISSTNNLLKEYENRLDFFIGVSTSDDSFVGNLGSQSFRFFSFVSNSRKVAMNLATLGTTIGVRILMDEETFNNTNHKYVTKPVDRLYMESSSKHSTEICNVYELVKEKCVAQEEWLYELNNLTLNKEIDILNSVFSIFKESSKEKSYSELDHYLGLISDFLCKFPNDPALVHLLSILQHYKELKEINCMELPSLKDYCRKICYSVTCTK